jgi:hypothetical protein
MPGIFPANKSQWRRYLGKAFPQDLPRGKATIALRVSGILGIDHNLSSNLNQLQSKNFTWVRLASFCGECMSLQPAGVNIF